MHSLLYTPLISLLTSSLFFPTILYIHMEPNGIQDTKKKILLFIGIGGGIFFLFIIIIVFIFFNTKSDTPQQQAEGSQTTQTENNQSNTRTNTNTGTQTKNNNQNNTDQSQSSEDEKETYTPQKPVPVKEEVITKIGEEKIYGNDIIQESETYATPVDAETQKKIIEKIKTDSIILQAAADQGLIELSDDVFNNKEKNYKKRRALIEKARETVKQKANYLKGVVISIWFVNDYVGPLGYEQAKKIAQEKIEEVYTAVKNGDMTIYQAGQQLKNDKTLAEIDEAYELNVMYEFDTHENKSITVSEEFDAALWKLEPGDISEIHTLKDTLLETGEEVEAIYAFGMVTEKQDDGAISNFSDWLAQQKKTYEQ